MVSVRCLTVLLTALLLLTPVALADGEKDLEQWADNYPDASKALGDWVKSRPNAAKLFFEWDGKHPDKSREFVTWTIQHPKKDIKDFADKHQDWPHFVDIYKSHKPAATDFMAWARQHPTAATTLMRNAKGLQWAGEHLYKSLWALK